MSILVVGGHERMEKENSEIGFNELGNRICSFL